MSGSYLDNNDLFRPEEDESDWFKTIEKNNSILNNRLLNLRYAGNYLWNLEVDALLLQKTSEPRLQLIKASLL